VDDPFGIGYDGAKTARARELQNPELGSKREAPLRILAIIGVLAILGAIVAGVFFFGGFYNVAAAEPDLGIVHWALVKIRSASIDYHADEAPPPGLDAPATIQDGARAYASIGCVNCHGAPGVKWAKFSEGLHPDPPDLAEVAKYRNTAQLFWVIKNGINMTGMPSFALAGAKDKELWSIVAFVKKGSGVSEADYKAWTTPPAAPEPTPAPAAPQPSPTPAK
jgi:mono/diheme cytochrome c family protein